MKIVKLIINYILSFILIFAIMISLLFYIVNHRLLNEDYVLDKMQELQYYSQIANDINADFENYKYQSGLPEDTLTNLFTEDIVKNDINSVVHYLYKGIEISESSEIIRENLDNKINDYIASENIKLNDQSKENIEKYEDIIVNEYKRDINASSLIYKSLRKTIAQAQKYSPKIYQCSIIGVILILIIMILLNRKNLLNVINYVGISILSLGVIFKILVRYVYSTIKIDNIVLFTKALTNLTTEFIKENLFTLQDMGNLFIFSGILAILVATIFNSVQNKKLSNQ